MYTFSILTKKKCSNQCLVMQQLYYFCSIIWNENVTMGSQDTWRVSGSTSQTSCILKNALSKNRLQSMPIASKQMLDKSLFLMWHLLHCLCFCIPSWHSHPGRFKLFSHSDLFYSKHIWNTYFYDRHCLNALCMWTDIILA